MSTLSFGTVHAFAETLEFELEQQRRQAAREHMLRILAAERPQPSAQRTARPSWRPRWPGPSHLSGAR